MADTRPLTVTIPDGMEFADLRLTRDPITLDLEFDRSVVELICHASGIDSAIFWQAPEDNIAALFAAWYHRHIQEGGAPDPVFEQIRSEIRDEQ
ncbi:MAG: hypothetical protein ABS36_11030 [Acidobacteria bacterium SCN 69-37]|nr:MAG: hypothetical protein ABS36_11030 [Acidobacteria bacterium SCN 69-37]